LSVAATLFNDAAGAMQAACFKGIISLPRMREQCQIRMVYEASLKNKFFYEIYRKAYEALQDKLVIVYLQS